MVFQSLNFAIYSSAEEATTGNSVIIMIGDGMGPEQVELGRLVEYGPDGKSIINEFPNENTIGTDNINGWTTDSAASGTAISSGIKTKNGRIGTNFDGSLNTTNILEIAEENGYKTGIVATCHITHATPAAFLAHNGDRGNYKEIAADIGQSGVDLIYSGGSSNDYFGTQIDTIMNKGYNFIENKSEFLSVDSLSTVGLFNDGALPRERKRNITQIPSLSSMVEKSINLLDSSDSPFFLMVEGSQIDWAGHDNDPVYMAHQMIEFEKSVRVAKSYAEGKNDVQLLVTADHECGGLQVGEYNFETGTPQEDDSITQNRTKRTQRVNEIETSFSTGGHTGTEVPLVGMGPYTDRIADATHHLDTFDMMRLAIEGQTGPVGEGFYDGYFNPLWLYIPGGIAVLAVFGYITYVVVKKIKAKRQ